MIFNKKILASLIMLFATSIMLATTVFAWITLSEKTKVNDFVIPFGIEDATLTFKMKKNNGEYVDVRTFDQINEVIANSLPNDKYYFRLTIMNNNQIPENVTVKLHNIKNKNTNDGYDMLDVFYLVDGKITTTIIHNDESDDTENKQVITNLVAFISEDEIIKHDQKLQLYRFNNITTDKGIILTSGLTIPINHKAFIDFVISYDFNTSHLEYQAGSFEIESIYIFF